MQHLVQNGDLRVRSRPDAIHFITDMLETENPDHDGFAQMLRASHAHPRALAHIVRQCWDELRVGG